MQKKIITWVLARKNALALLSLTAVVMLAFWPILFGGAVFFDEEQLGFYYPQSAFYQKMLQDHVFPTWNNFYYGGVSVSLDQFVSSFYPLHWVLFSLFPFVFAHHLSIVLAVMLGCWATYWFGREIGLSRTGSFVCAVTYLLGTTIGWLDIGTLAAHSFFALPVAMASLAAIKNGKNIVFYSLVGGVGLGVGLLAGFMQIMFYVCFIVFCFWVFLQWEAHRLGRDVPFFSRFWITGAFILMVAVSAIVGYRQVLPSVFFISQTIRTGDYAIQNATHNTPVELVTVLLPERFVFPFGGGGSPGFYVGPLGLFFLYVALKSKKSSVFYFFAGLYGVIAGFAFRIFPFSWINDHVPPFSHMGGSFRWMTVAALPLAFLVSYGLERFTDGSFSEEKIKKIFRTSLWAALAVTALLLCASFLLSFLAHNASFQESFVRWYISAHHKQLPFDQYLNVLRVALAGMSTLFSVTHWQFLIAVVLWPLSALFLFFYIKKYITVKQFRSLGALSMVGILYVAFFSQNEANYADALMLTKTPVIVEELHKREKDPNQYRIAGYLLGDAFFWDYSSKQEFSKKELGTVSIELLVNNINVLHNIQRMDGMEPYRTLRHNQLLNTVVFPPGYSIFSPERVASSSGLTKLNNVDVWERVDRVTKGEDFVKHLTLLSMMNVKYIYSLLSLTDPRLERIPLPQPDGVPGPLYLYENKTVLPRLYFADHVEFFDGSDVDLLLKIEKKSSYKNFAYIECHVCAPSTPSLRKIMVESYKSGSVHVRVDAGKGGWLIFGESYMPGWRVQIDGKDGSLLRANYLFQGVYVPGGEHDVTFFYQDITSYTWSELKKLITL